MSAIDDAYGTADGLRDESGHHSLFSLGPFLHARPAFLCASSLLASLRPEILHSKRWTNASEVAEKRNHRLLDRMICLPLQTEINSDLQAMVGVAGVVGETGCSVVGWHGSEVGSWIMLRWKHLPHARPGSGIPEFEERYL